MDNYSNIEEEEVKVNFSHDEAAGVLYVCKDTNRDAYADEELPGVLVRRAMDNDEVVGLTFIFFDEWSYRIDELEALVRQHFGEEWCWPITKVMEALRELGDKVLLDE